MDPAVSWGEQLSLFHEVYEPGDYIERPSGRTLTWVDLMISTGCLVAYNCSTQSHEHWQVVRLDAPVQDQWNEWRVPFTSGGKSWGNISESSFRFAERYDRIRRPMFMELE